MSYTKFCFKFVDALLHPVNTPLVLDVFLPRNKLDITDFIIPVVVNPVDFKIRVVPAGQSDKVGEAIPAASKAKLDTPAAVAFIVLIIRVIAPIDLCSNP